MRYFTYIAEQSFKTSDTGERLFYRGGPWSRPFIIPDAATERRLYQKQTWMLRILLGGMIVGQPFLFMLYPKILHQPFWFLTYLIVLMLVFWVAGRIVFAPDLKGLQRAPVRLRPRSFYGEMARRHSRWGLVLGLIGSLLFVGGGVWLLNVGANRAIAVVSVGFFGLCALAWGYALYLKLKIGDLTNRLGEDRPV